MLTPVLLQSVLGSGMQKHMDRQRRPVLTVLMFWGRPAGGREAPRWPLCVAVPGESAWGPGGLRGDETEVSGGNEGG